MLYDRSSAITAYGSILCLYSNSHISQTTLDLSRGMRMFDRQL